MQIRFSDFSKSFTDGMKKSAANSVETAEGLGSGDEWKFIPGMSLFLVIGAAVFLILASIMSCVTAKVSEDDDDDKKGKK